MHRVLQDIQQIRGICQQLVTSERQNAQMLSQQSGFANMAQTESHAAQQLQQCIDICNRMEQEVQQTQMQQQQQAQQTASFANMQQNYQAPQGQNPALSQVMQADRQPSGQQYQPSQYQQQSQPHQYQSMNPTQHQNGTYTSFASQPQPYAPGLNQVMQADKTAPAQHPAQPANMQQQYAPGLSQVMQADRNPQQSQGQSYPYRPQ